MNAIVWAPGNPHLDFERLIVLFEAKRDACSVISDDWYSQD